MGWNPAGAVAAARYELAVELVADLVRLNTQRRDARRRIAAAVTASKTTVTELFGVGPIIAATVIGDVGDIARFPSRDHFAAYNGTAPIEVSSGGRRKVFRLSRRGNRRLNHAIHMAAVTQIRYRHSPGRAYYDRKIAEGHSGKEAIRALKRRISDAIYTRLRDDSARATELTAAGPGGQPGNDTETCAAGSHPEHRLFGQATPEPATTLRPASTRLRRPKPNTPRRPSERPLDKQRGLVMQAVLRSERRARHADLCGSAPGRPRRSGASFGVVGHSRSRGATSSTDGRPSADCVCLREHPWRSERSPRPSPSRRWDETGAWDRRSGPEDRSSRFRPSVAREPVSVPSPGLFTEPVCEVEAS